MLKKLWPYARPYRVWIAAGVVCSAAEAVFELLIPLLMSDIVDIGIKNGDQSFILQKGGLMMAMALVALAFGLGSALCSSVAGLSFGADLRRAEYEHIQEFAFSNIEHFSTASLVTRLTSDVNIAQMTLMQGMRLLVRAPVMLVSALFLSLRISLQLSSVFLVALPLLAVVAGTVLSRVGPLFRRLQEKTDALNLVVQEDLSGIRVVKSFVREEGEQQKFLERNEALKSISLKSFGTVVMNMPLMMLIVYGTLIAALWFGGNMVFAGTMQVGKLTTFFTYISQIMMSLMMVSMIFMMVSRCTACARRVLEVLEETPAIPNGGSPDVQVEHGSIDFDHVYFRYHAQDPGWVLRDIDLHIPAGSTVGILGGTGSGKTSLVSLIPRLYEADQGTISVDGRNVSAYTMEHLRSAVSVVLQQNTLFSGTIRDNLLWGNPDATENELWAACRAACAEEFLRQMPNGLDTDLGQGGTNVSGGQKQRLCIARAILKQPKVLILDDSTSAVDTATDANIRQAIATELKGATKLIIAQRITSLRDADLIVVMDDGAIIAQGTHESLLASCDVYRETWESQQEGVIAHA